MYIFRYIPAEEIPIQYGGFKRENDTEYGSVSELILKAGSTQTIEIDAAEVPIFFFCAITSAIRVSRE